jgi:TonB family protein
MPNAYGTTHHNAHPDAHHAVTSLGPVVTPSASGRPVAALGRFWYAPPPLWPAAISSALHAAVLATLIWTVGNVLDRPVTAVESAMFMPPPQRQAPAARRAGGGMLAMVSLSYASGQGTGGGAPGRTDRTTRRIGESSPHPDSAVVRDSVDTRLAEDVYTSFEVDNAVQISYGSAVPQYPPDLLARRVQGTVTVRFVVDTSGAADVASLQILDSTDPEFANSVRSALPHMRFSPARLNGRTVRQLVEQPFRFNLTLPQPNPTDSAV